MTAPHLATGHRSWRCTPRLLSVLAILTALAGCGAPARIEVPAELPLRTNEQQFAIQWALQREATVVRAVGWVRPTLDAEVWLALALYGTDAEGRIVSRGIAHLRSEFSRGPIPFAVELTPTGREAGFALRILDYHVPGRRTN
jgi:hypothetical protein